MPGKPVHHALIGLALVACTPELDDAPRALGSVDAWRALGPEDDPMPSHRPAVDGCAPGGWYPEDGRLEVETGICHYLVVGQRTRVPVETGDDIGILAWHQGLDAAEPASAHLALFLDDVLLWQTTVAIPADPAIFEERVSASTDAPEGSWLTLHLHNHGFNTWAVDVPERLQGG